MYVEDVAFTFEGGLAIQVRPTWRVSRCGHCGQKASRYDRRPVRRWRHVPWGRAQAEVVFDLFHVQRLASDAVDEVRRSIVRELAIDPERARAVKSTRYILLKNPWNLSRTQRSKLAEIQATNRRLYRAYLLKETLAQAFDYRQPWRAEMELNEWLAWASRSKPMSFVKAARTIRKHRVGILAYIRTRLTNGLVEGINGKIRMITRRAFGFHSHHALSAMIFLNCGGIKLQPPVPTAS
jgi:transposase